MILFSFQEDRRPYPTLPDESFFLEGNDHLCLLIHGLTGTPREMSFFGEHLHHNGYSVAAPLLDGHSQGVSVLKRISWHQMYATLRQQFLTYSTHYQSISIGGLSFGALLGIALAHEFPSKVKAVVCFSPTLFFDGWNTPKIQWLLPIVSRTPLQYYFYFKEESPYGIKNERLRRFVDRYYADASLNDSSKVHLYGYPVIPVSCMRQNELLARYIMSIMPQVTTPLELLQAKDDDVTSPRNSQYLYDHTGSAVKEIVFFEDSYHIITADQEREKVAETAAEFFQRHTGR